MFGKLNNTKKLTKLTMFTEESFRIELVKILAC